jgi:hypothetical protein
MAAKRPFVSDLELQDTLSKLQKTNEQSVELIGQLGTQVDVLVKEVNDFQQSLVYPTIPISPVEPVVPIDPLPLEPVVPIDPLPLDPVLPAPLPTEPIPEEPLPSPILPVIPVPGELVITPTDGIDPTVIPEVSVATKSNLVINSFTHDGSFIPWCHKLMWDGKKYKSVSIYYKFDQTQSLGWDQVNYWEYMELDYGDSDLLAATLSFCARSRSNDITNGFVPSETGNGGVGYWDLNHDHNTDDTFYYVTNIRTNEADPRTGTYDHIKIFLHNVHLKNASPGKKIAQGLFKITRAVASHTAVDTKNQELVQFQVLNKDNKVIDLNMISNPEKLDLEDLKKKIVDYMSKPVIAL